MSEDVSKVGVISDLHANYEALQAVLEDMDGVDVIVCAGDIVGYGPSPRHCLLEMQNRDIPTVEGNHDRAVVNHRSYEPGDEYARRTLYQTELDRLADLPRKQRLFDGKLKVIHDHPDEQDRYTHPTDFEASLLGDEDILVLGHTHEQHVETFAEGIICNPGSVGQPRDGNPDAAYAVLNHMDYTIEEKRVSYDIERVQTKIREIGLSDRAAIRLSKGQ